MSDLTTIEERGRRIEELEAQLAAVQAAAEELALDPRLAETVFEENRRQGAEIESLKEKLRQAEKKPLEFGRYKIHQRINGSVWIENEHGEGMSCSEHTFAAMVHSFFKREF